MTIVDDPRPRAGGVRPIDALESHVKMIRALQTPGRAEKLLRVGDLDTRVLAAPESETKRFITADHRDAASDLDRAATIVVTNRMLSLIMERMADVPFGQPITEEEMPFRSGYVVLPRPVFVPNNDEEMDPETLQNSRPEDYAAFDGGFWIPTDIAVERIAAATRKLLGQPERVRGVMYASLVSRRLGLALARRFEKEESWPTQDETRSAFALYSLDHLPVYTSGWAFDLPWDPALREESFVLTQAGEYERRFWLALWKTLGEETIAPVHLPRYANRRAARLRSHVPEVVVADLRKIKRRYKEEMTGDGAVIMWSHRWRVREHTRTYHRGTPQERTIVIKEYVKGPTSMPILEKDTVYRLSR